MATMLESNKTKIAKRVIEVFEFFDGTNQTATVMDIVRRYGRPQSSTSELLVSLVEMGLLYKEGRAYSPTPRLATLGASAQPGIIRDGRLFAFMDRLARQTRCCVALFGMVGTHAQIFRWSAGADAATPDLACGASEQLSATTVGLLLLSTVGTERAGRMLRRLNAEAEPADKFNPTELGERVAAFRWQGHATGPSGFAPDAQVTAVLLPRGGVERPLALGAIYGADATIEAEALVATLKRGITQCAAPEAGPFANLPTPPLMMAV